MTDGLASALLTVVGSGTLSPSPVRKSAAHHLQVGPFGLLLDCGAGTVHGLPEHGVDWEHVTHVALTHFHTDHVGDLPALVMALKHATIPRRADPLVLVGPPGLRRLVEALALALGDYVLEPGFPVEIVEVAREGSYVGPGGQPSLRCAPTHHTDHSVAYRVDGPWGSLGYTGDTGVSEDVERLLAGCRVLIAECTHPDPPEHELHLTPSGVARLARRTEPELVVVTHVFSTHSPEQAVAHIGDGYGGRVVAGRDGMRIRIGPDAATVDPPASGV